MPRVGPGRFFRGSSAICFPAPGSRPPQYRACLRERPSPCCHAVPAPASVRRPLSFAIPRPSVVNPQPSLRKCRRHAPPRRRLRSDCRSGGIGAVCCGIPGDVCPGLISLCPRSMCSGRSGLARSEGPALAVSGLSCRNRWNRTGAIGRDVVSPFPKPLCKGCGACRQRPRPKREKVADATFSLPRAPVSPAPVFSFLTR